MSPSPTSDDALHGDPSQDLLSVVVPAYNESASIVPVLEDLKAALATLPCRTEIVVVEDGSTDDTGAQAERVEGIRLIRNPINLGYGHSLFRGIEEAHGNLLAITDADGTYPLAALAELYQMIQRGSDHAIGQRTGKHFLQLFSKRHVYRWMCGYVAGQHVPDANSGLRIFRREVVDSLQGDLCRGFSFTTSLTLASLLSGAVVTFTPISYGKRTGRSHVRFHDVLRTMQYLFQLVAVYNPLKLFLIPTAFAAVATVASFGLAVLRPSLFILCGTVLGATTLLLMGMAAMSYIVSRTGMQQPMITSGPGSVRPAASGASARLTAATSVQADPAPAGAPVESEAKT